MEIKYGEKEILEFDINNEENFWPNEHDKNYIIDIELPEFMAKCPRSGYPDFATIKIQYTPNKRVIELKALKIYINSFMNRYISHENSANEIFDTLFSKFLSVHLLIELLFQKHFLDYFVYHFLNYFL